MAEHGDDPQSPDFIGPSAIAGLPGHLQRLGIFYGWVVVFVCFVVIGLVFGVRLSFGVFFEALTRSGGFHWSRGDAAGVYSISMLVFALCSTPVGWMLDRLGSRRVFVGGLVVMASGLVMTSRMTSLFHYYLFYGVWTGLGITVLGLSAHAATISRWFDRLGRRGLAIGLAFSSTGVGILVLAPAVERIIAFYGWRTAFLFLAALLVGLALPLTLFLLRDTPAQLGLLPNLQSSISNPQPPAAWTWRQAMRTPVFWLIMLSGMLSLFTLRMVTVHQVAHFVDKGVPRLTAATVFGSSGLITALAFIGFGSLSDRVGRETAFYVGAVAQVAAIGLLIELKDGAPPAFLYGYALLWGLGEGSRSSLLTAIASDTFPGPALGAIIGTLGAFFGLGAALGSWLGGLVYDWNSSYLLAFELALVATIISSGGIFTARRLQESRLQNRF